MPAGAYAFIHKKYNANISGREMSAENSSTSGCGETGVYKIRIKGQIDACKARCFEGMIIMLDGNDSLLTGPVDEQAALHGLLKNTYSELSLISVVRMGERA